jgi:hypothetical protein
LDGANYRDAPQQCGVGLLVSKQTDVYLGKQAGGV